MIDLAAHRRIHFVGIGGIGMSALARLLLSKGYQVSGSDREPAQSGEALEALGARVYTGHRREYVDGADLLVFSSAIPDDGPELLAARDAGIPVVKRAELLGAIMNAGTGIAVAGTHGKTTTSALIAHILTSTGRDPTVLIGGMSANLGSNARDGASALIVGEADEYDASFLQLRPTIGVILNVEPDHLDFYGTLERLHAAFRAFATGVTGTLVVCADDTILRFLVGGIPARIVTYGTDAGEWRATGIEERGELTTFNVRHDASEHSFITRLAGPHNVRNCLAAIVVGDALGVPLPAITEAIATFTGVQRRFEVKGEAGGILVMDDYAHHPTEIRVNLEAMKRRFGRPIRVIFQPHTYSRTHALLAEFAQAFGDADAVYLLEIYAARESNTFGISGRDLATATEAYHPKVRYTETLEATERAILADADAGDLVVTMGAGDVYRLGPLLLAELERV